MEWTELMALKLFNTLSGEKEDFKPLQAGKVKMYVCGMTVYDYCHIGHARVLVAFDVITRYLRYCGYQVTYIRNITDVDDKIFRRANENGEHFSALTQRFIDAMHEDEKALNVLSPDQEPRATAHIGAIIAMIERLIANDHAYAAANGDVYYAVRAFHNYGQLSKKNIDELLSGARIEVEEQKRDPLDFTLWKAAKPGEECWDSPWGEGRPGWHIECSAMSTCCLGDTFDIHGGGPDLKFPHHENEIAQSEGATGRKYVNYWMHAGAVRVNKEKMSKSLGNFFTIREVLEKYPAEVVRFFLISSHYRSQVDYSELSLTEAESALDRLYQALRGVPEHTAVGCDVGYLERFDQAMSDDFNTPEALAVLFDLAKALNTAKQSGDRSVPGLAASLRHLAGILGVLQQDAELWFKRGPAVGGLSESDIEVWIEQRREARAAKDWAESDRIRDLLAAQGIILDDAKTETTWRRT
jgi:cysteinyl-tRNA synthetase